MKASDPETGERFRPHELWGQSILMHTAGSDTYSFSGDLLLPLSQPACPVILSKEIRDTFHDIGEVGTGGGGGGGGKLTSAPV